MISLIIVLESGITCQLLVTHQEIHEKHFEKTKITNVQGHVTEH